MTGIELMDTNVEVSFVLDEDIDLGSETTAAVKVATLLGTHYLEVDPQGSADRSRTGRSRSSGPWCPTTCRT